MANLANKVETKLDKTRVPMSVPQRKLEVPEIEGYHTHWMSGQPGRIAQALRGGYEFVCAEDIDVHGFNVANNFEDSGSTDLGEKVSIISGVEGGTLYLMKIRNEFFEEDQDKILTTNERIAAQLRATPNDAHSYIPQASRKAVAELFVPKNRR